MKLGCGLVQKTVHGQRYLYVWSFQLRGNDVRRVEKYIGPARSAEARDKALRELDAYAERAMGELGRRRARWRRQLAAP